MAEFFTLISVGLLVGFAGGTLGVGGGFLLVPILFSWLGWAMIGAVATSHFCGMSVSSSATKSYAIEGLVEWRLGIVMEAAAVLGSAWGAWSAHWVSTPVVAVLFCGVALFSVYRMWSPRPSAPSERMTKLDDASRRRYSLGLPAMFLVGAASGILGLGGGVFIVPILTEIVGLPIRRAVATSVFMIGLNGAAAGAVYFIHGDVASVPTSILASGVFVGAAIGAAVQKHLPSLLLRRAFAIILAVLAVRLAFRALG